MRRARRERDSHAAPRGGRVASIAAAAAAGSLGGSGRSPVPRTPGVAVFQQRVIRGVVEEETHEGVTRGGG